MDGSPTFRYLAPVKCQLMLADALLHHRCSRWKYNHQTAWGIINAMPDGMERGRNQEMASLSSNSYEVRRVSFWILI